MSLDEIKQKWMEDFEVVFEDEQETADETVFGKMLEQTDRREFLEGEVYKVRRKARTRSGDRLVSVCKKRRMTLQGMEEMELDIGTVAARVKERARQQSG